MEKPWVLRAEAERCVRLARQTIDDSVASVLFAYARELEQHAHLLEGDTHKNSGRGFGFTRATGHVAADR